MKNAMPVSLAAAISALLMGTAQGQVPVEARQVGAPVHTFSISPAASAVQLRGRMQFSASTSDPVSWEVNGVSGGSAEVGTITRAGPYTAPVTLPKPFRLVVTARLIGEPKKSESALINLATGAVYYVATSGSDSNPGTQAAPWLTIQHAAASVKAGDTVNIRKGTYKEAVTPLASGSAAAGPITFQSYPGEIATIDGTGLKVVNDRSGLFNISNRDYITVSGLEISNFTSNSDSQVPVGIYVSG